MLSVVLVAGVIPTTVFAESTYGVLVTGYHEYYPTTDDYNSLDNTRAEDGHGTVVLTDEHPTAVDENVWTKYNGYHGGGSPKGYSSFIVYNTNPDVATVSVQPKTVDGHGAMDITFTKGTKEGSTKITIDFFIDGLSVEWGIATDNDYSLLSGQIVYNVNNGEGGSGETDKPSKPTLNDVPANDGSDPEAPVKDYPWMCKLVLDSSWYLNKYNKNYASTSGTHYLAYPNEVVYARFFSDGEGGVL